MSKLKQAQLILIIVLLFPVQAFALGVVRYVDGSLSADCTSNNYSITNRNCTGSNGNAYNTIAEGRTATAAGDTLRIRSGTYQEFFSQFGGTQFANGLSASQHTIVEGCPVSVCGDAVISAILRPTAAQYPGSSNAIAFLQDKQFLTIRNLHMDMINGPGGRPIQFNGATGNIKVEGNRLQNCPLSCIITGNPESVERPNLHITGNLVGPSGGSTIYLRTAPNAIIERNYIYDGVSAYCIAVRSGRVAPFYRPHNTKIRFNWCQNNTHGINAGGGDNIEVYGNIVNTSVNNSGEGASGGIYIGAGDGPTNNLKIYNNTVYSNWDSCIYVNITTPLTIRNNLCLANATNLITNVGGASITATNNTFTTATTVVVDAANGRFSPREGSVLIADGTSTGMPAGYTCIVTCDVGAFQAPKFSHGSIENGDANSIRLNWILASQGVRNGIGLKAANCSASNFAVTIAGSGANENSCGTSGDRQTKVGVSAAVTAGQAVTALYTRSTTLANNLQDNSCVGGDLAVGGCKNAEVRTTTTIPTCPSSAPACFTNNVSAAIVAALSAINHRWFNVQASIASPQWRGLINGAGTVMKGGHTGFVLGIDCTLGNCDPVGFQVYFNRNGGTYEALTDDTATNMVAFGAYSGSTISDSEPITSALITNPHGSFVAGKVVAKQATNPTVDLTQNSTTQLMALIKVDPGATVGEQFCFQPRTVDGTAITQTNTPCITIVNPALSTGF